MQALSVTNWKFILSRNKGEVQKGGFAFEDSLQVTQWLAFLNRVNIIRTIATAGVQYWFYAQVDSLGCKGHAQPSMSVDVQMRHCLSSIVSGPFFLLICGRIPSFTLF